jgi:hypothetical protein
MATATKTEVVTVTLVLSGLEASALIGYLAARESDPNLRQNVKLTDDIYTALKRAFAPF